MNDMNHPDNKKMKEKPHLTLVVDNTGVSKDELAEKWKEGRDNKNSEINQTESARVHIFGNIQKTMKSVGDANKELSQSRVKNPKYNGIRVIIASIQKLLNSIKIYK